MRVIFSNFVALSEYIDFICRSQNIQNIFSFFPMEFSIMVNFGAGLRRELDGISAKLTLRQEG
jgi:hypothetical protein